MILGSEGDRLGISRTRKNYRAFFKHLNALTIFRKKVK